MLPLGLNEYFDRYIRVTFISVPLQRGSTVARYTASTNSYRHLQGGRRRGSSHPDYHSHRRCIIGH